jgi:hypothetical protein
MPATPKAKTLELFGRRPDPGEPPNETNRPEAFPVYSMRHATEGGEELVSQATNNTKEQFGTSPTLSTELINAIMDALKAHQTMSKQALASENVRDGLKEVLLGPGQLWEALRGIGEAERTLRP